MKKTKILLSFLMAILLLTGCSMKANYEMEITNKGEVKVEIESGVDRDLIEKLASMSGEDLTSKSNKELLDFLKKNNSDNDSVDTSDLVNAGFTINEVTEDDFIGYRAYLKIENIDTLIDNKEKFNFENIKNIKETTLFEKNNNTYKLNLEVPSSDGNEYSSYIASGMNYEMKFTIKLPNKPITTNASTISEDGKTLTWNLLKDKTIEAEFDLTTDFISQIKNFFKENQIIMYAAIAIVVIIIIIIILAITSKKGNKKEDSFINNTNTNENIMAEHKTEVVTPPIDLMKPEEPINESITPSQNNDSTEVLQIVEPINTFVPEEIITESTTDANIINTNIDAFNMDPNKNNQEYELHPLE